MAEAAVVEAAAGPEQLLATCKRRLAEVLQEVDDTDLVWLEEIREEAIKMFGSHYSDEPELMPKTPSQKTRQRKKRYATQRNEDQEMRRRGLSRRKNNNIKLSTCSQSQNKENLELSRAEVSLPQRVTRSQTAALAKLSEVPQVVLFKNPVLQERKLPTAEINISNCISAELCLQIKPLKVAQRLRDTFVMTSDKDPPEDQVCSSSPAPAAPKTVVASTPQADDDGGPVGTPQLNEANATFIVSTGPGLQDSSIQAPERDEEEALQRAQDIPGAPKGLRLSPRSVRRSLMGKAPPGGRSSLSLKRSRSSRKGSKVFGSVGSVATRARPQPSALAASCPHERNPDKNGKSQEPPQGARRKPSYKRAVDECYDNQQAEDGGLSPPRKKTPSRTFPASKVVRPIKTFLHTVQKNQLLMTPSPLGGNMVIKSFIRHNTPDPREKERQKLEILRKKKEAEQVRKQKLEEEKKRRLDEAKLRREERWRRVQESRERALQLEQERKQRIKQKIAHFEEKTERVREERLAEEKIKKKAAAKKMEEAEARRRQEEEARKQRALQQEEEERRHKELMQKRKEEEQERARKILEQRQAEQEREKQLAAHRELQRKREQERIQADKLREQQQKAARLQKEAQAAEEQLQEEQQKEQRLAEMERQKQEHKRMPEEQKDKDRAQTQHPEEQKDKDGNSGACNSYQMTPHAQRHPKPFSIDPNNYGMDLNSDDSTDDESQPRKPIPAWACGEQLTQAVTRQYYNPPNVDEIFGVILSPRLEDIFYKSKPRYFKRTSSAIWNFPPCALKPALPTSYSLKKC
ncbi:inner centromere protein [Indicator indicator]|uniref:inner centromere protein n=1 Tax=Indicator indicator TaxID=1002788 RepID=UPI0023DEA3A5|nr:inner centromere protein [Indicator indicator]